MERSSLTANPSPQIILSTSLNDRNQKVSLNKQHKIVAESAFERIFSYCSGHLNEDQQKSLTGEDRIFNYPGEPLGGLLRSFRFGSTGMKRWELPTDEIKELLANELYTSSFNRILYQNWDPNVGSMEKKLPSGNSGEASLVSALNNRIQQGLIESTELEPLVQSMTDDFTRATEGLKKKGYEDLDLDGFELHLRDRFTENLNGVGVEAVFGNFGNSRPSRLSEIVQSLEDLIRSTWTRNVDPLGFAYIPNAILKLQDAIRSHLETSLQKSNETQQRPTRGTHGEPQTRMAETHLPLPTDQVQRSCRRAQARPSEAAHFQASETGSARGPGHA